MNASDSIARTAAVIQLLAVLLNLLWCGFMFLSWVWALVGFWWLLLAGVALLELGMAHYVLVRGATPGAVGGSLLGIVLAVLALNPVSAMMELLALVMFVTARSSTHAERMTPCG